MSQSFSVSSKTYYINKGDRTSHWVGNSKLKELDINDLFEMKHMIKDMELDSLGNVNHDISVIGYWIFDSNYKRSLVLNRELLDMISSPSVLEEQVAKSERVFNGVGWIFSTAHLRKK